MYVALQCLCMYVHIKLFAVVITYISMYCTNSYRLFLYTGAFVCNISSPSFNTIEVSCKLLGILVRVNVLLNCTSCTDSQLQTITDDSPIVISEFPAGNYIVDVIAVDFSNDIIRTVEVIVMSEDVTTDMSPTSGPTTTATTHNLPTTTTTTTTAIITVSTTMYTNTPTTTDVLTTNRAATDAPTTESNIKYSIQL